DSATPQGDTPNIAIFERTHHMGGRARSTKVDGASIPIDMGAMRFSSQLHPLVNGLATHFKFPTREFPVSGDQNLQVFRGVHLTNKEVKDDPTRLPFHLAPNEQGKSANELLGMAIGAVIPNFQKLSAQQWKDAKKNTVVKMPDPATGKTRGVPLQELGLQNIL